VTSAAVGNLVRGLEAAQRRLDQNPQAMRVRRETLEHPFGTMKARLGATHFLTKTLPKVVTEMALSVARLQSHGRHEYRWHKSPDRDNRSVSYEALSSISAAPMRPGGLILNA